MLRVRSRAWAEILISTARALDGASKTVARASRHTNAVVKATETIGFRDPRIDRLSESRELNFFLIPFLSKKLPQQMKVNVAGLLRQSLANSIQTTGYQIKLDDLKIHSMQVSGDSLVVDFDGDLSVN